MLMRDFAATPEAGRIARAAVAMMFRGDHAAIDDAAQEALLYAITGALRDVDFDNPRGAIYRAAKLRGLQIIRESRPLGLRQQKSTGSVEKGKKTRKNSISSSGRMDERLSDRDGETPEEIMMSAALPRRLEAGMALLTECERDAINAWTRHDRQGPAAAELGLQGKTFRSRVREAKARMKRAVEAGEI